MTNISIGFKDLSAFNLAESKVGNFLRSLTRLSLVFSRLGTFRLNLI